MKYIDKTYHTIMNYFVDNKFRILYYFIEIEMKMKIIKFIIGFVK